MEKSLHYLIGDVTKPIKKPALICHINNDIGGWGRGVVLAIGKAFPEVEEAYRAWFSGKDKPRLGQVQFVDTHIEGITVANMIAQHDIRWRGNIPPIRYEALEDCLKQVYDKAVEKGTLVVMPRIGAVLSGGEWATIEDIIKKVMRVETFVYTLENQRDIWPTTYEGEYS